MSTQHDEFLRGIADATEGERPDPTRVGETLGSMTANRRAYDSGYSLGKRLVTA